MSVTLIGTGTVGAGGASTIDFTGISSGFTDLWLVASLRGSSTSAFTRLLINGATASGGNQIYGNSSSAAMQASANFVLSTSAYTANTFGDLSIYMSSNGGIVQMAAVGENNGTAYQTLNSNVWPGGAITSISISGGDIGLAQYSTASLYGVTNGNSGGITVG